MYIIRYILVVCQVYDLSTFIESSNTGEYSIKVIIKFRGETQPDYQHKS